MRAPAGVAPLFDLDRAPAGSRVFEAHAVPVQVGAEGLQPEDEEGHGCPVHLARALDALLGEALHAVGHGGLRLLERLAEVDVMVLPPRGRAETDPHEVAGCRPPVLPVRLKPLLFQPFDYLGLLLGGASWLAPGCGLLVALGLFHAPILTILYGGTQPPP